MRLADAHPTATIGRLRELPRGSFDRQGPAAAGEQPWIAALLAEAAQGPTYGDRRLTVMLRRQGWRVTARRVRRLMHEPRLAADAPQRKPRATHGEHGFPRFENLVEGLQVVRPEQVGVADITSARRHQGFVHLAVLRDVFTRVIRGWNLGRSLEGALPVTALRRALVPGCPEIHHCDQGVQYAAPASVALWTGRDVALGRAAVGKPEENGFAERLMRTLQDEEVDLSEDEDLADARRQWGRFLDDVDHAKRIHSSPGGLQSPSRVD